MNIIKANEIMGLSKPTGWIVKVQKQENGTPKFASYGIYVGENNFLSIPLHYVLIDKLVPLASPEGTPVDVAYYGLPNNIDLKLIKSITTDKTRTIPLLVPCREGQIPDILACVSIQPDQGQKILNMHTNGCIVKSYLDKERKSAALMMVVEMVKDEIVPTSIGVNYTTGIVNGLYTTEHVYTLTPQNTPHKETQLPVKLENGEVAVTEFIKFRNIFIDANFNKAAKEEKPVATTTLRPNLNTPETFKASRDAVKPLRPNTNGKVDHTGRGQRH